jgi:purine nucleosidase
MPPGGWVITCDPGIDDAVALAVAAGRDDIAVAGIVAGAGNVGAGTAWRNAAGMAALAGLDVPVAAGTAATLDGSRIHRPGEAHGPDGLGGLAHRLPRPPSGGPRGASDVLVAGVGVLALGPLTEVALARRAGVIVERLVWLGGAFGVYGPLGEFNASVDPVAVDEVLAGVSDLRIVPIDVSGRVRLDTDHLRRWASGRPLAQLCAALAAGRDDGPGPRLHDPVAVVAAAEPSLFAWEERPLRCSLGADHARGALVADDRPAGTAVVAVDVDAASVADAIATAVTAVAEASE